MGTSRVVFAPHGRVDFSRAGQRLLGRAEGPFNVELARDVHRQVVHWCQTLRADGPFDRLCVFHASVPATPDAMAELGRMVGALSRQGLAPARTAYVFGPEVEGGDLLAPSFVRAFAARVLRLCITSSESEALAWLDGAAP